MQDSRQLRIAAKQRAKTLLFTNLGKSFIVTLIGGGISVLCGIVTSYFLPPYDVLLEAEDLSVYYIGIAKGQLLSFLLGMLVCPLTYGTYAFFINLVRDGTSKVSDVFTWFGDIRLFGKAIRTNLYFMLLSLGWTLLYGAVPGAGLALVLYYEDTLSPETMIILAGIALFVLMVCEFFAYIRINAYTPALYLISGDTGLGVIEAFKYCSKMMKRRKGEFLVLILSFIGWEFLAFFSCGLSFLFVTPYITLTIAAYTEHVKNLGGGAEIV